MQRRARGRGAVYLRADGRWEAQFRMADGRRKCLYGRTRREVLSKLRETRWAVAHGLPVSSRKLLLSEYLEYWLEMTRCRVRTSTYQNCELNVRRLTRVLGRIPLLRLSPPLIQEAYRHLRAGGLSDHSVLQTHRVLNRCLMQAFHWGLIPRNPTILVFPPRPARREMTALSADHLLRLLDHTRGHRLYPLWVVLGTTGLRLGEALGLSWDDVNIGSGRVVVRRGLQRQRRAGKVFVPLKTARSYRTVVLTRRAVEALRDQRQLHDELRVTEEGWNDQGLVFPDTVGGPMEPGHPGSVLRRVLREAGLPPIRVHDLRHTAATIMLVEGVHPKVVQDMLGHSTITTTLDTYSHVMPTLHDAAVRKLDLILDRSAA